ncbi:hypothetical protein ACFE04_025545 [Oxalis oulophora]
MDKRKWPWKKKSSERSPGETESSGSISSQSEKYSDDQSIKETLNESTNHNEDSSEITSKTIIDAGQEDDNVRRLTEKLSAALVNVSAKEDLVKQHSKVAEEAVAGWEKAENEVSALKLKLEAAVKQNFTLEDRVSHLDGALKECVRQLRQAREEQEQRIHEAVQKKTHNLESGKSELENQILEFQRKLEDAETEPDLLLRFDSLENENSVIKLEFQSQAEELEIRTIERDLSTQAAETASKQHLESIKKVAKLESECRRIKAIACKQSLINDHKSNAATSTCAESLTDCQSDGGEQLNKSVTSSDSWTYSLMADFDQLKNGKAVNQNLLETSVEIDLMHDFLEMERLAALDEENSKINLVESVADKQNSDADNSLRAELENMTQRAAQFEKMLEKLEAEKYELQTDLCKSQGCTESTQLKLKETEIKLKKLQSELFEANEFKQSMESRLISKEADARIMLIRIETLQRELVNTNELKNSIESQLISTEADAQTMSTKLEELQKELDNTNELKQTIESQLMIIDAEARTLSRKVDSLQVEAEKERDLSAEFAAKCKILEEELIKMKQEDELRKVEILNCQPKIKQEDLSVAAGRLAECQQTIASLGKQLKSLATLEDFLTESEGVPDFSTRGTLVSKANSEPWRLHANGTFSPKREPGSPLTGSHNSVPSAYTKDMNSLGSPLTGSHNSVPSAYTKDMNSPGSSSSSSSHVGMEKNRNGFAKFFSRSKNGIQLEI